MNKQLEYLLLVAAFVTLQGCFVVRYTGMPVVYDSIHLDNDQVVENIPYSTFGIEDPKGQLDLFLPSDGNNWPVVVFVHGGGWSSGDKALKFGGKRIYLNIGRYFASQGIAAAVINYRLIPGVHWSTQIGDVALATQWVHDNIASYGGNPDALFLAGHSAGAQLISHVALNENRLGFYGMNRADILGVIAVSGAGYEIEDAETNHSGEMMPYLEKRFAVVDKTNTWQREASILRLINEGDPPFQIFVGGAEVPGLIRQSTMLKETLDMNGVANTFEIVPGRKHARMILLMSGNGSGVGSKMIQFVKDNATTELEQN